MIRVVVADEQTLVRRGLEMVLADADGITVVGSAASGREAVEVAGAEEADVVLLDLGLKDLDGFGAIRALAAGRRVVVLTSHQGSRVVEALKAGAVDCVPKRADPDEIVRAIRAAAHGESRRAHDAGEHWHRRRQDREPPARLTDRDWDVVLLLARGHSNKVIAQRLDLTVSTVKTHLTRIYRVLDVAGRTQAALWAQQQGLDGVPPDRRATRVSQPW